MLVAFLAKPTPCSIRGRSVFYMTRHGDVMCATCAKDAGVVVAQQTNWRDPKLNCDRCWARIPRA